MHLALNNLQRLICHKTQTTNQPNYLSFHFQFYPVVSWNVKVHSSACSLFFFFLLIITRFSGRLSLRVVHTSVSSYTFTVIWNSASLLGSPGLFSVFWLIWIMFCQRYSCSLVLNQVGWGCTIHQLHLCRGVGHPLTTFLDMTLNNLLVRLQY